MGEVPFSDPGTKSFLTISQTTDNCDSTKHFFQLETKLVTKCRRIAENIYNLTCENLKLLYRNSLPFLQGEWLS